MKIFETAQEAIAAVTCRAEQLGVVKFTVIVFARRRWNVAQAIGEDGRMILSDKEGEIEEGFRLFQRSELCIPE